MEFGNQTKVAASIVLKKSQQKKKEKKRTTEAKVSSTAFACCYGCGAPLQTDEFNAPGYVNSETYELVRKK